MHGFAINKLEHLILLPPMSIPGRGRQDCACYLQFVCISGLLTLRIRCLFICALRVYKYETHTKGPSDRQEITSTVLATDNYY